MYSSRKICFFRLHYQTAALDVIGKRENFFFPTERYAIKHVNYVMYEVCSNNIWIGVVVVVHWEGCVCNQSWHVRTCLSNSWHKLRVAAFAQLAVVGRGNNTHIYVTAILTMCESTEQRICIKFCFKIGKTARKTYQLLQQAYGKDAMDRTQVFVWFRPYKEGALGAKQNKGHVTGVFWSWGYRTPRIRSRRANN